MAEVFPRYYLLFSILAIFTEKRGIKDGPKVQTLNTSLFHKNLNPSKNFQAKLDYIWGSKSPKTLQKGYFMEAESVCKTLKIYNLTPHSITIESAFTLKGVRDMIRTYSQMHGTDKYSGQFG